MFGDDDVIEGRNRLTTATCNSHKGVVYRIDAPEFFRRIEHIEDTRIEVRKQLYTKQKQMDERLQMIEGVYNIKPSDIMASVALEKFESKDGTTEEYGISN